MTAPHDLPPPTWFVHYNESLDADDPNSVPVYSPEEVLAAIAPYKAEIERLVQRQAGFMNLDAMREAMIAAADGNAKLRVQVESLLGDLWWLVGGGEFSHWIESGVEMPWAAMKEWQDARRHFPDLVKADAALGEKP